MTLSESNQTPDHALGPTVRAKSALGTHLAPDQPDDALFVTRGTGTLGDDQSALSVRPGAGLVRGSRHEIVDDASVDIDTGGGLPRRDVVYLSDAGTIEVEQGTPAERRWPAHFSEGEKTTENAVEPAPPDMSEVQGLPLAVIDVDANSGTLGTGAIEDVRAPAPAATGGSGGSTAAKNALDYDGANGGAQIQAAVDVLPPEGGDVVVPAAGPDVLSDGADGWFVDSPVEIPSNVTLRGTGRTPVEYAADHNAPIFKIGSATAGSGVVSGVTVAGFRLDGRNTDDSMWTRDDGATANPGLVNVTRGHNVVVRDCEMVDGRGYAVKTSLSSQVWVIRCESSGMRDDGFTATDAKFVGEPESALTDGVAFIGCYAHDNFQSGFEEDDGPRNVFHTRCLAENNDGAGFRSHTHAADQSPRGPGDIHWRDCVSRDNGYGALLGSNVAEAVSGFHFDGFTVSGSSAAAFAGPSPNAGNFSPISDVRVSDFDISHPDTATEAAVYMVSPETLSGFSFSEGTIDANGGMAVESGASTEELRFDGVEIAGTVTDGGVRTQYEGVGENAGDPSSTGEWAGAGYEGAQVVDTTNDRLYTYRNGGWV